VGWDNIIRMALTTGWTVWGSNPSKGKLSAPVQTSNKAHPASYIMGTGPFPEVRWLENGDSHPPPTNSEVKERVQLYLYSSEPSW